MDHCKDDSFKNVNKSQSSSVLSATQTSERRRNKRKILNILKSSLYSTVGVIHI